MHPDEAPLLQAVCAAPADDLPRLVYADWLDDHGHPLRAEFIRAQIELHRLEAWFRQFTTKSDRQEHGPDFGRRLSYLRRRVQRLLTDHHAGATGLPADFPFRHNAGIERGFLCSLWASVPTVPLLADVSAALGGPLPEVGVHSVGGHLTRDDSEPHFAAAGWSFVTSLSLNTPDGYPGDGDAPSPAHLARLARAPLHRLHRLVGGAWPLSVEHARVLAERFTLPALRAVDLSGNVLSQAAVRELGRASWWAGLHELELVCEPPHGAVAEALREAVIRGLRRLRLQVWPPGSEADHPALERELEAVYPQAAITLD